MIFFMKDLVGTGIVGETVSNEELAINNRQ